MDMHSDNIHCLTFTSSVLHQGSLHQLYISCNKMKINTKIEQMSMLDAHASLPALPSPSSMLHQGA